jgi:hypothetical protein
LARCRAPQAGLTYISESHSSSICHLTLSDIADFMPPSVDLDRDVITYCITAYSTLLHNLPQLGTIKPAIPRNHDFALLGQFYNHLATLLNTGASDYVNSSRVVSVTGGPITKDRASVTIVSEDDSPKAVGCFREIGPYTIRDFVSIFLRKNSPAVTKSPWCNHQMKILSRSCGECES